MWRSHFAQALIWNRHQPPVLCLTNVRWRHQNRWRWMSTSWRASWVPMTLSWWNKPCEVAFRNAWVVMPNQSSKFHLSALTKSLASGFLNRLWQFQIYCMPLRSRAACAGFAMLQDGTLPCKSQREENLVVRKSCCTTSLSLALHSLLCKQKIHRWIAHAVVACQISHPCPLKANRSIHILAITVIWTALCRSSRTTRVERRCTVHGETWDMLRWLLCGLQLLQRQGLGLHSFLLPRSQDWWNHWRKGGWSKHTTNSQGLGWLQKGVLLHSRYLCCGLSEGCKCKSQSWTAGPYISVRLCLLWGPSSKQSRLKHFDSFASAELPKKGIQTWPGHTQHEVCITQSYLVWALCCPVPLDAQRSIWFATSNFCKWGVHWCTHFVHSLEIISLWPRVSSMQNALLGLTWESANAPMSKWTDGLSEMEFNSSTWKKNILCTRMYAPECTAWGRSCLN